MSDHSLANIDGFIPSLRIVNELSLVVENRFEPWIVPVFHSSQAYVLRTDDTLPPVSLWYSCLIYDLKAEYNSSQVDLVTLMALVQLRVDRCGL